MRFLENPMEQFSKHPSDISKKTLRNTGEINDISVDFFGGNWRNSWKIHSILPFTFGNISVLGKKSGEIKVKIWLTFEKVLGESSKEHQI